MVKQYMGKDLGFQYSSEKFEGDMEGIDAQAPTNEVGVLSVVRDIKVSTQCKTARKGMEPRPAPRIG